MPHPSDDPVVQRLIDAVDASCSLWLVITGSFERTDTPLFFIHVFTFSAGWHLSFVFRSSRGSAEMTQIVSVHCTGKQRLEQACVQ